MCFQLQIVPEDWKQAYIYPIPKPSEWQCDITKTRPLTLLDTLRKAVMKIITNQLSNIMARYSVLKGNNFAGLPGGSTEILIKVMNMIIEDAKEHHKPIWILLQDLFKAYDRVDLDILRKAMEQLKISTSCINFILDFFIDRKNAVITKGGLSDLYDVKIGIDQGEVISPLLWCIYFDSLLCAIQDLKKGYTMTHQWMSNVSTATKQCLQEHISALGFMDDVNWISSSLEDLEIILDVADNFYKLIRAAINKEKSRLLTNTTSAQEPIPIQFGTNTIPIQPNFGAVRFLRVKINIHLNHSLVKKELRAHIRNFVNLTKSKPVTDRQFCYIANHVLFPQLLYKMKNTPLSKTECSALNRTIRCLYKHKCQFPKTAPNALFHASIFYNLNDLWTEQLAEISTTLLNQFNNAFSLLRNVSTIRLFHLQKTELATTSPLQSWTPLQEFKQYRNSNVAAHLYLIGQAQAGLKFQCNAYLTNHISGGSRAIKDTLPSRYLQKYRNILIKYNLLYQEQFISLDGSSFCFWQQFRKRRFASHITTQHPPKFYRTLQSMLTQDLIREARLLPEYDHDTGRPIERPGAALYTQALNSVTSGYPTNSTPFFLPSYLSIESNPLYPSVSPSEVNRILPDTGYYWLVLPHPSTAHTTIGRIYTRDATTNEGFLQHYKIVTEPFETFQLKNTKRNLASKGKDKYASTTNTSAIIKYTGCFLHIESHLNDATRRAHQNFRSPLTCIFKQSLEGAKLIPVKSHQLYKDIILLQHHLKDYLVQVDFLTNPLS